MDSLVSDRAVTWDSFRENVEHARQDGYALVCSECGAGITDAFDMHDEKCSHEATRGGPRC